jgi:hypothetical protein
MPFDSGPVNSYGLIIRYDLMRLHKRIEEITADDVACMPPEYPCHLCRKKMEKK